MQRFYRDISLTSDELAILRRVVSTSHRAPYIYESIEGINASKTTELCAVYDGNEMASFAWIMQRYFAVDNAVCKGLSVGIVTTMPHLRSKGYASLLLTSIEREASDMGIDFIYLAGIERFYQKFGYSGFAPKSKIVLCKSDLPERQGRIVNMKKTDIELAKGMYSNHVKALSSHFYRTDKEWADLIGPLSSTFVFHKPKIVLNSEEKPIAYFCDTPKNDRVIREFVCLNDTDEAINALSIISRSESFLDSKTIEIFTPAKGPIWEVAARRVGGDYYCFLRPRASNMMKWISAESEPAELRWNFILQGEML